MNLFFEYLKDWILMDKDCKPRKLPPASVLGACQEAYDQGRINSDEFRELIEIGDADRAINAAGGAS